MSKAKWEADGKNESETEACARLMFAYFAYYSKYIAMYTLEALSSHVSSTFMARFVDPIRYQQQALCQLAVLINNCGKNFQQKLKNEGVNHAHWGCLEHVSVTRCCPCNCM